jgi:hypothetical protein
VARLEQLPLCVVPLLAPSQAALHLGLQPPVQPLHFFFECDPFGQPLSALDQAGRLVLLLL